MTEKPVTFAVLGLFEGPDALLHAIRAVKAQGLGRIEAYTPYPVHGLDAALGLRRSPLAGMVLVMGIVGAATAMLMQGWMSAVDYPLITSGKAPFSWQAFVPILFELMVLFATFTAGLGMLILLNRLPLFRHPLLLSGAMTEITRDRFALTLEAPESEAFDVDAARDALGAAGAASVEVVSFPAPLGPVTGQFASRAIVAILVACALSALGTYWAVKLFPVLPPMSHMERQPRVDPMSESRFFKDDASMRMPVPGTIARGFLPYPFKDQEEATILVNPIPRTEAILERGKKIFGDHCAVCHGAIGDGASTLTAAYGAKPANLLSQTFRDYPDGKIYHVIVAGKNSMPSYAADIRDDDRWAVVHYVRALQRAQNATDEDLRRAEGAMGEDRKR